MHNFPFDLHTQLGSTALDRITHTPRCLGKQFASGWRNFHFTSAHLPILSAISPENRTL